MKLRFLGLFSLAMVVCLASALTAQEEGQQRQRGQRGGGAGGQRGGPGGPGGGRGGFGGMGGFQVPAALELMGLLRDEKVRKEVSLEEDTYEAIREAQPDMQAMFQASEDERAKMMKEANTKAQDMLDEVFEPAQQKRLMGLLVQQRGNSAVTNELIAKEIGLDEAGIKKVQEVAQESQSSVREKMREMFQGGGPPDREKMQEAMAEARKAGDEAIAKALTADQKQKLEALKGEKFEFSENAGFGGFGRGPGGGGRGPGGGRPGGNNNDN